MGKNSKGASLRPTNTESKDSNSIRIGEVKDLFLSGRHLTAIQINMMFKFNDARKVISDIRKNGWHIIDRRLPDGRKEYYLKSDGSRQLSFIDKEPKRISSVMEEMTHDPRSMLYGLELKKEVRHE